jgi:hypothetical protein
MEECTFFHSSLELLRRARCSAAEYANAPFSCPSFPLFFVVAAEAAF